MANPGPLHWDVVKIILHYLKHSNTWGIFYSIDAKQEFPQGWTNVDWAGNLGSRKSTSRYVFLFGGGAISWQSRKQQLLSHLLNPSIYLLLQLQKKPYAFINHSMI